MNTMNKKSSTTQLTYLSNFMAHHPDMARGHIKKSLQRRAELERQWLWLAKKLNSLGGSIKTVSKWKQAWRDLRNNKKRQILNSSETSLQPTSDVEERVYNVMGPVAVYGMDDVVVAELVECPASSQQTDSLQPNENMEWTKSDTLKFIDLWHKSTCLWDTKTSDYRNKQKRCDALSHLAHEMHTSVNAIEKKMFSLRTQYSRELGKLKSRSGDSLEVPQSNWYAFKYLHFTRDPNIPNPFMMDPFEAPSPENYEEEVVIENDNDEQESFIQEQSTAQNVRPKSNLKRKHQGRFGTFNLLKNASKAVINKKNKDEFSIFGETIASELRNIKSIKHIIVLKKGILDLIYKIKLQIIENESIPNENNNKHHHSKLDSDAEAETEDTADEVVKDTQNVSEINVTNKQLRHILLNLQKRRKKLSAEHRHRLSTEDKDSTNDAALDPDVSEPSQDPLNCDYNAVELSERIIKEERVIYQAETSTCASPNSSLVSEEVQREYHDGSRRERELEVLEKELMKEKIREARTKADLAESIKSTSQMFPEKSNIICNETSIDKKEYINVQKRANELHLLEVELLKERIREAKVKADLAQLIFEKDKSSN